MSRARGSGVSTLALEAIAYALVLAWITWPLAGRLFTELPDVGILPVLYTVQDAKGEVQDLWVTRALARKHKEAFLKRQAQVLERLKNCRGDALVVSTEEGKNASTRVLNFLCAPANDADSTK